MPGLVDFGDLYAGYVYRSRLTVVNTGVDFSRFRIRQPSSSNVSVLYSPCQIAAGMSVSIEVEVQATQLGSFQDKFLVLSELDQFPIPIIANVIPNELDAEEERLQVRTSDGVEAVQRLTRSVSLKQEQSRGGGRRGCKLALRYRANPSSRFVPLGQGKQDGSFGLGVAGGG
ncbi:hypothetical protein GUITHDRAFT_150660 [Guillardia theta CCMP2712]|uniref:MSP domain-containing protein n=3 Tax=Guillardia theta TaxID=55529 RepID=L1JUE6_GUITC|nr:hypothetical protein GUITHDRAFT_150660 [Guillardia theta CCMP2712]EKX52042.1 hypothetical protein GUITHDRAFT_150660 [Guillardia theta CCMP2712]|eukprot:XP_005839022.1 hypothetical protein GUITHDRAFT_150660 [Guillardia theta CCMP2712]